MLTNGLVKGSLRPLTINQRLNKLQRMACLGITGAMKTTPTAAIEGLTGLPPLRLQMEADTRAGIYIDSTAAIN
jgi:hypothetical protein